MSVFRRKKQVVREPVQGPVGRQLRPSKRRSRKRLFFSILMLLSLGFLGNVGIHKVYSIASFGPDDSPNAEFDGANVWYELSWTTNVHSDTMTIPIYAPSKPSTSQTISLPCAAGGGQIWASFLDTNGSFNVQNKNICANNQVSIPPRAFVGPDTSTGYYKAQLHFELNPKSGYKAFRVRTGHPNWIVGFSASYNTSFTIANMDRCDAPGQKGCSPPNNYFKYAIPFTGNCTIPDQNLDFTILDPDNGTAGIQPNPYRVRVVEYDASTAKSNPPLGKVVNPNVILRQDANGGGRPYYVWVGKSAGNSEIDYYNMHYESRTSAGNLANYALVFDSPGVYSNNVLQFNLPANLDSINTTRDCNRPPNGNLNLGCNPDGTGYIKGWFRDPDGSTTATVTANYANGDSETYSFTDPDNTQYFFEHDVLRKARVDGRWSAKLVVQDKGGSDSNNYVEKESQSSCTWSLKNTASASPRSVVPGQTANFTFNTHNQSGVMKTDSFDYWNRYVYLDGNGRVIGTWTVIDTRTSNGLAPQGDTAFIGSWSKTVPLNIDTNTYKQLCVQRVTSVTSSSDNTNLASNPPACVRIVPPSCSIPNILPDAVEPTVKFNVQQATFAEGTAAATQAAVSDNRDKVYMNVYGPQASDGSKGPLVGNASNSDIPRDESANPRNPHYTVNNRNVTETANDLGPTNDVGTYTIEYGIGGPTYPINCEYTFSVGYLPYFNVTGDMTVGAVTKTGVPPAQSCIPDNTAGVESWNYDNQSGVNHAGYYGGGSQAAIYALGHIKSFATGQYTDANTSPLAGRSVAGSLLATNSPDTPHAYSFASSPPTLYDDQGNYGGQFAQVPCTPDFARQITSGGNWNDNYGKSGTYVAGSGPGSLVTVSGGTLRDLAGAGHGPVINLLVNGDAYINSDILYDLTGLEPGQYPQFTLIATGNIYVGHGVSVLHGKYIAQNGTFATCADDSGQEETRYDDCNQPLTVYGAVVAQRLDLDRSYGTLTSTDGPAENFVYSPELWLATPDCLANPTDHECSSSGAPSYTSITSLPPVL